MNISTPDEDPEFRGGAIESVELHNFMCHEHLKVDLRGSINFIVGNNGSKPLASCNTNPFLMYYRW